MARSPAHPRYTVDDTAEARLVVGVVEIIDAGQTRVAMPAGGRKSLAAIDQPRPPDQAFAHGPGEADLSASDIADGGEAAIQHTAHD